MSMCAVTNALPRRFRRPRLLIVGCGDIGMRVARLLSARFNVTALTSDADRVPDLRSVWINPLVGNLDEPMTLRRMAAGAHNVLHLAPPAQHGATDERTAHLIAALARAGTVRRIVYGSTTGVYGDCRGARFDETRAVAPATDRARRRVDAEQRLRGFGLRSHVRVSILRIPGIYASDRVGGRPRDRLERGTPVLIEADDVYTNHIHANDLARACVAALGRGRPQRVTHACDDTELKMGDYFDLAADLYGLPRPPRVGLVDARSQLGPIALSFLQESRRLDNTRLKRELRLCLRYPTVREGLIEQDAVAP